jgi:hypothetical protein
MNNPLGPLTLAQINTLLAETVGNLQPYRLAQLVDALNRRTFADTAPTYTSQPSLTTIAAGWAA